MPKTSYLIFLVDENRKIDSTCLDEVEKEIKNHQSEKLFLVLQTYGGDPFSAVAIMTLLRKRFQKIYILIPNYAKSAGTLMALGGDVIYMSDKAALGPLDLPMEHPRDGSRISALDIQNIITTLSNLSESIANDRYKFLRQNEIKLSRLDSAKLALHIATEFVKPVIQQIDPYHLQKSYRELRVALFYAIDLLSAAMMKNDFKKALRTARAFVNNYPAHEYSIFLNEAKNALKLTVEKLESLKEWKIIKKDFEEIFKKYYFKIIYIEKNDVKKSSKKR